MNDQQIKNELAVLLDRCAGIQAVMVATDDGFAVHQVINNNFSPNKLAAMSSSLMSLAESVVREAGSSACNNLIIEADGCLVVLLRINAKFVLTTISQNSTGIGMLLSNSKLCKETLVSLMD